MPTESTPNAPAGPEPRVATRELLRDYGLTLLAAIPVSLFLTSHLLSRSTLSWPEAFTVTAYDVLPWVVAAPLLLLLTDRLPIAGRDWWKGLLAHLAAGAAVLTFVAFVRPPGPRLHPPPGQGPPPGAAEDRGPDRPRRPRPGPGPEFGPPRGRPGPPGPGQWFFRRGLQIQLPILLLVVLAAHLRYFQRRSADRERHARELAVHLAQARLEALRMQLQPHFLFNALNGIAALIHSDPERADEMTTALADFLRHTLHGAARDEVPLIEELEYTKRYLAIEQARFGERLHCQIDAPPETYGALVPMLLLQPLIENVVRHGVTLSSGAVRVRVRVVREGDRLRIVLHDNGAGPEVGAPEGIGLANTRARLRELHGGAASLTLRAEQGCVVEIVLPFRLESHPA